MRFKYRVHVLSILIVIGLIAIVASLYVRYYAPYREEHHLEKLDAQRVKDIDALDAAIQAALQAQAPHTDAAQAASTTGALVQEITALIQPRNKNTKAARPSPSSGLAALSASSEQATTGTLSRSSLQLATSTLALSFPTPRALCPRIASSSLPAGWSMICDASTTAFTIPSATPACNDIATSSLPASWSSSCTYPHYVYISIPSASPNCDGIDLPALPDAWSYRCAPESSYRNADGTGWLPLNLTTQGITTLPIDPVNEAKSLNYYAYVHGIGTKSTIHALSAFLRSRKYVQSVAQNDDGFDTSKYEKGDNMLWAPTLNLSEYWPLDEGKGLYALNKLDSSTFIVLPSEENWINHGSVCPLSACIRFFDLNQSISANTVKINKTITLTMWVRLSRGQDEAYELFELPRRYILYAYNTQKKLSILASAWSPDGQSFANGMTTTEYDEWHQIGFMYGFIPQLNGNGIANILDGKIYNPHQVQLDDSSLADATSTATLNKRGLYIGEISTLKIYDDAIGPDALAQIYRQELESFK